MQKERSLGQALFIVWCWVLFAVFCSVQFFLCARCAFCVPRLKRKGLSVDCVCFDWNLYYCMPETEVSPAPNFPTCPQFVGGSYCVLGQRTNRNITAPCCIGFLLIFAAYNCCALAVCMVGFWICWEPSLCWPCSNFSFAFWPSVGLQLIYGLSPKSCSIKTSSPVMAAFCKCTEKLGMSNIVGWRHRASC